MAKDLALALLVVANRAWRRLGAATDYQAFPASLNDSLPCIPVPLREDLEIPLDLQFVFNTAYDDGPYLRGAVDYREAPQPLLEGEYVAWADQLLVAAKLR